MLIKTILGSLVDAFSQMSQYAIGGPPSSLLWEATFKYDSPRTLYLAPPCDSCIICSTPLVTHNQPTTVVCYTENGPIPALKIILCCPSHGCGINYRYDQYGNENIGGYRY